MKFSLLVSILLTTHIVTAQKNKTLMGRKTIFIELLGTGGPYSINYDQIFYAKNKNALSIRGGINHFTEAYSPKLSAIGLLTELNYLRGKPPHHLEIGTGFVLEQGFSKNSSFWYFVPRVGYRHQFPKGGIFYRIGFTPVIPLEKAWRYRFIYPWGGVSMGYTF